MVVKDQDHMEYFGPTMAREDLEDLTKEKRDTVQEYIYSNFFNCNVSARKRTFIS